MLNYMKNRENLPKLEKLAQIILEVEDLDLKALVNYSYSLSSLTSV